MVASVWFSRSILTFSLASTAWCSIELLAFFELGNNAIDLEVFVGGFFAGSGDNERGTRFIDQDRIDFVDDREVMTALDTIAQIELHVVSQVIEAELVVGAIG